MLKVLSPKKAFSTITLIRKYKHMGHIHANTRGGTILNIIVKSNIQLDNTVIGRI